jgi:hypothetical protein
MSTPFEIAGLEECAKIALKELPPRLPAHDGARIRQ